MPKLSKEIILKNPQGLHARPAALFVQIASKSNCDVMLQKGNEKVNGKSIMGILTLGAQLNTKLIIHVEGGDAEKTLQELEGLLNKETGL